MDPMGMGSQFSSGFRQGEAANEKVFDRRDVHGKWRFYKDPPKNVVNHMITV